MNRTTMRIRTGLLICCCAGLTACTAAPHEGPVATATKPSVGRPAAPASAQAAMSSEAFTPYAGLGASTDDGLAPGDTYTALHTACMNDAGYGQYASVSPLSIRENRGLAFAQPFGPWGYLGTALAAQEGFNIDPGQSPGQPSEPGQPQPSTSLPTAAEAAAGKCLNVVMDFNNAQFTHSMAGVETMNDDISNDVVQDPDLKQAQHAWSACMAKNGYTAPDPDNLALQQLTSLGLRGVGPGGPSPAPSPSAGQNQAQIATAVADADCTDSTDLAGIYFAIQASYEQQFVSTNQQQLNTEVRQYKAAFAAELRKLPALLRTISATPQFPGGPPGKRPGRPQKRSQPG
ncbi:MAG: hypothetical protein ACRDRJ_08300 [Streptosporangiaceae bacterium]